MLAPRGYRFCVNASKIISVKHKNRKEDEVTLTIGCELFKSKGKSEKKRLTLKHVKPIAFDKYIE